MNVLNKAYVSAIAILCFVLVNCEEQFETPQLISYTSSECEAIYFKNRHKVQTRILSQSITDSSQVYSVLVATNCERTAEGDIEFKNDTLKLTHHGRLQISEEIEKINDSVTLVTETTIEELVECDCTYELRYEIYGLKTQPKVVTLNGKTIVHSEHKYNVRLKQPIFEIVNNDTINIVDIYGLKQKTHVTMRTDGKLLSKIYYVDNQPMSGLANVRYHVDGFDRIEIHLEHGNYTKRKYYKNEKLLKSCDTKGAFDDDTNCTFAK